MEEVSRASMTKRLLTCAPALLGGRRRSFRSSTVAFLIESMRAIWFSTGVRIRRGTLAMVNMSGYEGLERRMITISLVA